jgi:integrase
LRHFSRIDAVICQFIAAGMARHVRVNLYIESGCLSDSSTIAWKPRIENGVLRSLTNTNGDLGTCSRCSRRSARSSRPVRGCVAGVACLTLRKPNAAYRSREHLTEREVERPVEAAKDNRWGHRDSTMVLLTFRHGLRAAELVDLRWEQVDLENAILHEDKVAAQGTLSICARVEGYRLSSIQIFI